MRTVPFSLQTSLNQRLTFLARLWSIERLDGVWIRLTDHDEDITYGGNVYKSAQGFTASAVFSVSGIGTAGVNFGVILGVDGINEDELMSGQFDDAKCELHVIDWKVPTNGVLKMFAGTIENVRKTDAGWAEIEVSGLERKGRLIENDVYSASCRADFGDERCKVDIEALKVTFIVTEVTTSNRFKAAELDQDDDYWNLGVVRWLTGDNENFSSEVADSDQSLTMVALTFATPFAIQVGDTGEIWPGCDKLWTGGCVRWDNRLNFRGEIFAPGEASVTNG